MAPAQSKRQSRKRRKSRGGTPVLAARRPEPVAERRGRDQSALGIVLTGKVYGERPEGPFGGVPVSEIAILAGGVGVVVGLTAAAPTALVVGIIVCALGVLEVTAREHFSGYRSHTTLLAAIPAVGVGVGLIAIVGGSLTRSKLLLVVIPVFGVLFVLLRKRFRTARQARVTRPPAP